MTNVRVSSYTTSVQSIDFIAMCLSVCVTIRIWGITTLSCLSFAATGIIVISFSIDIAISIYISISVVIYISITIVIAVAIYISISVVVSIDIAVSINITISIATTVPDGVSDDKSFHL